MRPTLPKTLFAITLLISATTLARAELSQKEAKRAIAHMSGFTLEDRVVRIESVTTTGDRATAVADLQAVFRLSQKGDSPWGVSELRGGPGHWESVATIAEVAKVPPGNTNCVPKALRVVSLNVSIARCLIANLFGNSQPSDAVRIKELSTVSFPFGTESSALVVSHLRLDLHFKRDSRGWEVAEFKCGEGPWFSLSSLSTSVDSRKRDQANSELATIASALGAYRKKNGSYVVSEKQSELVDLLSPRYLPSVIAVDPWHNPYHYRGERDRFTLTSAGPDGKLNTADDVVVSN